MDFYAENTPFIETRMTQVQVSFRTSPFNYWVITGSHRQISQRQRTTPRTYTLEWRQIVNEDACLTEKRLILTKFSQSSSPVSFGQLRLQLEQLAFHQIMKESRVIRIQSQVVCITYFLICYLETTKSIVPSPDVGKLRAFWIKKWEWPLQLFHSKNWIKTFGIKKNCLTFLNREVYSPMEADIKGSGHEKWSDDGTTVLNYLFLVVLCQCKWILFHLVRSLVAWRGKLTNVRPRLAKLDNNTVVSRVETSFTFCRSNQWNLSNFLTDWLGQVRKTPISTKICSFNKAHTIFQSLWGCGFCPKGSESNVQTITFQVLICCVFGSFKYQPTNQAEPSNCTFLLLPSPLPVWLEKVCCCPYVAKGLPLHYWIISVTVRFTRRLFCRAWTSNVK